MNVPSESLMHQYQSILTELDSILFSRHPSLEESTDEERKTVEALAEIGDRISLVLADVRLGEPGLTHTVKDDLTGLFSRSYLEELLENEIVRARRRNRCVSAVMFDVDRLEVFRAARGEAAGALLLQAIAETIQSQTRLRDFACRYQHAQFALVMPEAPARVACERAEQLRGRVHTTRWCHSASLLAPVTLSAGVASFPQHAADGASLLREAGKALRHATEAGRNRVVLAEPTHSAAA